jgi:RNA polymerase sigma-70 factor (ECF subfamily)
MFERHSGAIGRTLRRQGFSADAAEDATQQAFLIASQRLDEIRPDRERAFLFGVVLRVTSSKRRRLARYQFEADMDQHAAPESAPDLANERVLALELFNQVLEKLDEDLIQAFVLFELQQLSKNEVAAQLGIPPGTAASRRRRARQTVEATLARLGKVEQSPVRTPRAPGRVPAAPVSAAGPPPGVPGSSREGKPAQPLAPRLAPTYVPAPLSGAGLSTPALSSAGVSASLTGLPRSTAVPLLKVSPAPRERRARLA